MSTVIDELIVKLGLDPTDFTNEEAKLAESLRKMEERASRAGKRINDDTGRAMLGIFRLLRSPISGLRQEFEKIVSAPVPVYTGLTVAQRNYNAMIKSLKEAGMPLKDIEEQGKRAGESVEGGALAGARGLRVLGAAGLGLFAAYEGLSKVIENANAGAQRLFATGIGAAAAGMNIQEFTAISQALNVRGNVPVEQTQQTLGELKAAQVGYTQPGPAGDAARARLISLNYGLAALGITDVNAWSTPPEEMTNRLSADFARMPADKFNPLNISQQLGLTPEEVYGMRQAGTDLPALTEKERERAVKPGQPEGANELLQATNNLDTAWQRLSRDMNAVVDGPLSKLENVLAWILDHFAGAEETHPGSASGALGAAIGAIFPGGALIGQVLGAASGANAPSKDTRTPWQRYAPSWLGGKDAPTSPGGAAGPQSSVVPQGWQPGDYPNAPATTSQTISHPERNNPGNLRASDSNQWLGKTTQPGDAFESFDTMEHGIRARALTYSAYLREGANTITQIAARSGPASDGNDIASQIAAYRQALGGQYAQPGGENLPIDPTPENIRRLTAGGISIEAGGGGKWLPQGADMNAINQAFNGMSREGGGSPQQGADVGGIPGNYAGFLQDPRNLRLGGAVGRPDLHPEVVSWLNDASHVLPPGYHAMLRAGPANHTEGTYTGGAVSQVTLGQAADIDIVDPSGKHLPNPVDTGQFDPLYKVLGDAYVQASGGKGRWGGNYGRPDPMQYGTVGPGYPAGTNAPSVADLQLAHADPGGSTVTHNAGDVNLHGNIVVNAPLREGSAIGDAVADRVKRVSLASTANTGLE